METCMLQVFNHHVYTLLDTGAKFSFMTSHIVVDFCVIPKILEYPFSVSITNSRSTIAIEMYRVFPVIVSQKVTLVDLVELEMIL